MVNVDIVTAECREARTQADTARDLAMRLRGLRARLDRYGAGGIFLEPLSGDEQALGEAIAFLSALGGQV